MESIYTGGLHVRCNGYIGSAEAMYILHCTQVYIMLFWFGIIFR